MNKSVYSLVLSNDVVDEIDRLAYLNSTNRSNMINQILAEYVSLTTPEKKMQEVFDRMESVLLGESKGPFQLLMQSSNSMFSLRSAISYKYNPTVRYSIELYKKQENGTIGELRISLRTQNQNLIAYMTEFYKLWNNIECMYFDDIDAASNNGKYVRKLKIKYAEENYGNISGLTVGDVISNYINAYDKALKCFFNDLSNLNYMTKSTQKIKKIYEDYLKEEVYI